MRKVHGKKLCPRHWHGYCGPTSSWCNKFRDTNPQISQMIALKCASAPIASPSINKHSLNVQAISRFIIALFLNYNFAARCRSVRPRPLAPRKPMALFVCAVLSLCADTHNAGLRRSLVHDRRTSGE